jgi:hypothetical protein
MPLKKFDDYLEGKSSDPSVFEKKVIFATQGGQCDFFKTISEEAQIISETSSMPIVIWGDFKFTPKIINENRFSIYNINLVPTISEIYESFQGSKFIPRLVKERQLVSSLNFPIIASTHQGKEKAFKTYSAFKKSEDDFKIFTEQPKVQTKFDVTVFKKKPIHIQENIRDIGFDINLNNFKYLKIIEEVCEKISENHILDLYQLNFGESGGKLYLTGINRSSGLGPTQKYKAYESIYEDHYARKLPVWFKNRVLESKVKDHYRKSYYNSLLLKPKYSINFEKFLK